MMSRREEYILQIFVVLTLLGIVAIMLGVIGRLIEILST